jgi:hypothetical protein
VARLRAPSQPDELKAAKAEAKRLRAHLTGLTQAVARAIKVIDAEMAKPSTPDRGKTIARCTNALEMANDSARYFGLGIDFRKDKK